MNNKIRALFGIGIFLSLFFSISAFSETVQYTYDNLDRITKAEYSDGTVVEYTYDAAGNRMNEEVKLGSHTITASADSNGTILPSGVVTVDNGADQQFMITPDTEYNVADVKVDGSSVGPVLTYTFTNVTDSHTIEVTFEADAFPDISVTPTSQDYGTLDVGSSSPAQTFTVNNTGNAELLIGPISVTGTNISDFNIQSDNCSNQTITPLGTCTVDIIFSPTSEGSKSANLTIPSNDPDTPQHSVQLTGVGTMPPQSIELHSGWNLISLNMQPTDATIATVLESINGKYISVWAYQDASWNVYDPLHSGFTDLTTMSSGPGYWINMKEPGSMRLSGSYAPTSINLNRGWNLVGYNADVAKAITNALASIAGNYISVWAYINGGWKVYDPANPGLTEWNRAMATG